MKIRVKKYRSRWRARRGRSIPYISRNKVYFGRGKQIGSGVSTRLLAKALQGEEILFEINAL